jgi:hypothetical protein
MENMKHLGTALQYPTDNNSEIKLNEKFENASIYILEINQPMF